VETKANGNRKWTRGFTLVEIIVVAVIVLILAVVAIPMYNGYVKDAKLTTAENLAETTAAAANTIWRRTGGLTQANLGTSYTTAGGLVPNLPPLNVHFDADKHIITLTFLAANASGVANVTVTDKKDENITVTKPYRN
jgi:prepilin-type N-terminal cleavage/methylation domain-containing protein